MHLKILNSNQKTRLEMSSFYINRAVGEKLIAKIKTQENVHTDDDELDYLLYNFEKIAIPANFIDMSIVIKHRETNQPIKLADGVVFLVSGKAYYSIPSEVASSPSLQASSALQAILKIFIANSSLDIASIVSDKAQSRITVPRFSVKHKTEKFMNKYANCDTIIRWNFFSFDDKFGFDKLLAEFMKKVPHIFFDGVDDKYFNFEDMSDRLKEVIKLEVGLGTDGLVVPEKLDKKDIN